MAKDLDAILIFGGDDADVFITAKAEPTVPVGLAEPGADYADLGWLSEEGITLGETPEQNDFYAHQGGTMVASVILREEKTLRVQCLESTAKQAGIYWSGMEFSSQGEGIYGGTVKGAKSRHYGLIVDDYSINQFLANGDPVMERYVIEDVVLAEKEELAFRRDGIRMWGFTFKILGEYKFLTNNPKMAPANAIPAA